MLCCLTNSLLPSFMSFQLFDFSTCSHFVSILNHRCIIFMEMDVFSFSVDPFSNDTQLRILRCPAFKTWNYNVFFTLFFLRNSPLTLTIGLPYGSRSQGKPDNIKWYNVSNSHTMVEHFPFSPKFKLLVQRPHQTLTQSKWIFYATKTNFTLTNRCICESWRTLPEKCCGMNF